jgi:hypothetical protein
MEKIIKKGAKPFATTGKWISTPFQAAASA